VSYHSIEPPLTPTASYTADRVGVLLWVIELPSATVPVVVVGLVLCPGTVLFSWLTMRLAATAWRSGRGAWWLRLSSKGFEINDRVFTARRYEWHAIDKFMRSI
jgi:hypothetical protein